MARPISIRLQILLLTILMGLAAGLWLARGQIGSLFAERSNTPRSHGEAGGRSGKDRETPVIVAMVEQHKNDEAVAAVGTARARRSVTIQAKTDGVIVEFLPRAGDHVRKGDLIFRLDDVRAKLALRIAKQKLDESSRQLDRSQYLKQQSVNSNAKVEDARTLAERAELEMQQANELLQDLKILAPFDGVVGIPKVEVGDSVTAATPIISLDDRGEILVEFVVAEKYLARITVGDPITALTPSHDGKPFAGRIEYIDSRVDSTSRTVAVRAVIPNDKDLLRPGMSFAVEMKLPGDMYPAVPELSLQWRKGESYVWTVQNNTARKVLVRTVKRLNSIILVEGDLKPGELVVIEGVQRLRPGRAVVHSPPKSQPPTTEHLESAKSDGSGKG